MILLNARSSSDDVPSDLETKSQRQGRPEYLRQRKFNNIEVHRSRVAWLITVSISYSFLGVIHRWNSSPKCSPSHTPLVVGYASDSGAVGVSGLKYAILSHTVWTLISLIPFIHFHHLQCYLHNFICHNTSTLWHIYYLWHTITHRNITSWFYARSNSRDIGNCEQCPVESSEIIVGVGLPGRGFAWKEGWFTAKKRQNKTLSKWNFRPFRTVTLQRV